VSVAPWKVSLLAAIDDAKLFGGVLKASTWSRWKVFLRVLVGAPLSESDLELYRACTGRERPPAGPFAEIWLAIGRRGGKTFIAALLAVAAACLRDYRAVLAPGERATVMIVAQDRRQARVALRYVVGMLKAIPMFRAMIVRETTEGVELNNGVVIEVHTASFRSVRGYTLAAAICDEIAFWRSDDSANPDAEILAAIRPGLATIPGAWLICISTPYARRGELWRHYQEHWGKDDSPVLFWTAATRTMNPSIPDRVVEDALKRDRPAAEAEYLGEFRRDVVGFLDAERVDAVTIPDRYEIPHDSRHTYVAFADASGGSRDSFTAAVAHREGDVVVLDAIREIRAPFSPKDATAEISAMVRSYGVTEIVGDRYAGEWPREAFADQGLSYVTSDKTRSQLYVELLPLVNGGRCELLESDRLRTQLVNLERRTSASGRDTILHPPGTHDDVANAAAGALVLATTADTSAGRVVPVRAVQVARDLQADGVLTPGDWLVGVVATEGRAAVVCRSGQRIESAVEVTGSLPELVESIRSIACQHDLCRYGQPGARVLVDKSGSSARLADRLSRGRYVDGDDWLYGWIGGLTKVDPFRSLAHGPHADVRSRDFFTFRSRLEDGELGLPDDDALADQVAALRFTTVGGQLRLEPREEYAARSGRPPLLAEAVAIAGAATLTRTVTAFYPT
jgi:hypothetical protein